MRPVASVQSAHRFPLNTVFGAESHVRILRVLADSEEPLSTTSIAERAELTAPGARRALGSLTQTGLIEPSGSGKRQQYELSKGGPLAREILELFHSEQRRATDMLNKLREAVRQLSPPPTMVWTPGFPTRFEDSWEIGLVHTEQALPGSIHYLRRHVGDVEQKFGVTVKIVGFTTIDPPNIDVDRMLLLLEKPVDCKENKDVSAPDLRSDLDSKGAAAFATALVKLIERDPSLVKRARLHVVQILEAEGLVDRELEEWHDILRDNSIQDLSQFLASSSERAVRLRPSSPFLAILSGNEREHLLANAKMT